jgi:hypothetical protein
VVGESLFEGTDPFGDGLGILEEGVLSLIVLEIDPGDCVFAVGPVDADEEEGLGRRVLGSHGFSC